MKRKEKLSERLRKALEDCGKNRSQVAKDTGLSEGSLSRFARGERGLSMDAIDALAAYLGLELKKYKPDRRK